MKCTTPGINWDDPIWEGIEDSEHWFECDSFWVSTMFGVRLMLVLNEKC